MIKDLIKKSPLISYFVIAYAVTWIALLPLALKLPVSPHWHFLGAFGPAVSAFLVTYLIRGREGVRELKGRCLRINIGAIWIILALIGPYFRFFWRLWHLPMFFYRFSFSPALIVGFFVSMFVGAILFTFVFNSTRGSVFCRHALAYRH